MAKKPFSDESKMQKTIDAAWAKYQKANTKNGAKKTVKKAPKSRKK